MQLLYRFCYLYRDAGNYKCLSSFVVCEKISFEEIRPYLIDELYFIPPVVGLKRLIPDVINSDDHDWHEIESIE